MNQLPSLRSLRVFQHAANSLSFTQTAIELDMTQPAVSQCIKQLEALIGCSLFIREHRVLKLSRAGEAFYHDISIGLSHIEQSVKTVQRYAADDRRVTLSVSTAFATHWLLPRIAQFKAQHPNIDLRFQTTHHDIDLAQEGIALGVRHGNGEFSGYRSWRLFDEDVVPVCRPDLLQNGQVIDVTDLTNYPLIHLDEPHRTRLNWDSWLKASELPPAHDNHGLSLNDYAIVLQSAAEGQGIALGWRYIVQRMLDNGQLVEACNHHVVTSNAFYLVAPLSERMTAHTRIVKDWMIAQL